ncbi:MAG: ABC transporter substrate-binding protein [Synergistaceae bacterium]|nr:ABC transporter substrate-binding protein [Synergistaceae bacterium]
MPEDIRDVLSELIETYGIKILEDPDRLSQFLEDRCGARPEETFHLTFALRYLLRSGWRASRKEYMKRGGGRAAALTSQLGFTGEEAERVVSLIDWMMEQEYGGNDDTEAASDGDNIFVATPGNLKKISGGISKRPRGKLPRQKSIYNGLIMLASVVVLAILFFQISSQRTPVGDELRIAFFAPMSGAQARLGHVQLRAAQLAVERINRQGPLRGGYRLKVVGFDLPETPEGAVAAVGKAMEDKSILAMLLGSNDGAVAEIARLAESMEAPMVAVSPLPPSEELLDEFSMPYLYSFSLENDAAARGKMLSYFATQALKKKKIALYYDPSDKLSSQIYRSARKWALGFGAAVVAELPYSRGGSHAAALKAFSVSGADLLMLPGVGGEAAAIVREAKNAGFNETILGEDYTEKTSQEAGAAIEGSWWLNEISALDPPVRSVLSDYRGLYNENCPPEDVTAAILAYDGVRWIASALQNTPGFRGEAIRHTLLATKNLALTHATLTVDPRTHLPLNKAMAAVYCAGDKGIFQRRVRINKER